MRGFKRFAPMGVSLVVTFLGVLTGAISATASGGATKSERQRARPRAREEAEGQCARVGHDQRRSRARSSPASSRRVRTATCCRAMKAAAGRQGQGLPATSTARSSASAAQSDARRDRVDDGRARRDAHHLRAAATRACRSSAASLKAHARRGGEPDRGQRHRRAGHLDLDTTPEAQRRRRPARGRSPRSSPTRRRTRAGPASALDRSELTPRRAKLFVYRTGLVRGDDGHERARLRGRGDERRELRDVVFVHAQRARSSTATRWSTTRCSARLYEQNYRQPGLGGRRRRSRAR